MPEKSKKNGFKKIGIIAKTQPFSLNTQQTVLDLLEVLTEHHCEIILAAEVASLLGKTSPYPFAEVCKHSDLCVVVGGDGMLLRAAQAAVVAEIPIVGINRGHLGFLADISPQQIAETFAAILKGDYKIEDRFLLSGRLHKQHLWALNDFVLSHDDTDHMIEIEIKVNGELLCEQNADGLIISTPTGSTAYALSGGGPILHPDLEAVVIVPMFSHRLTSRPIVLNSQSNITLTLTPNNTQPAKLSYDGQTLYRLLPGEHITITRHDKPLQLLHPQYYDYYTTLRSKLSWGV